ncbi:hypothetical protein NDU88_003748 [Pleurodeles waltl]|uniref:Uncharacterized protein n=1 Tax=Pleurodeles waltl TaxID=8319 RepID=A0AAV7WPW7_PLEWA|nr:hypothetical protein NDU88_003748 [Pleurodeles waltl]
MPTRPRLALGGAALRPCTADRALRSIELRDPDISRALGIGPPLTLPGEAAVTLPHPTRRGGQAGGEGPGDIGPGSI